MSPWRVEVAGSGFLTFLSSLPHYEQAVVGAAIQNVLSVEGIGICANEWGKPLGNGLYEFRIRKSLQAINSLSQSLPETNPIGHKPVLIRIFCAFHGDKIVVLHHGYDKQRDPSAKRQQREIRTARKLHEQWKLGLK